MSTKCGRRSSPGRAFRGRFGRRSLAGVTSSPLNLIAASGHEPPPAAHLIIVGVAVVAVLVALVTARRRREAADEHRERGPEDAADRERNEP